VARAMSIWRDARVYPSRPPLATGFERGCDG
jgi:hypothetical protein